MKTDLIINLLAKEGRHIEDGWVKDVPMGRLGRPSELQGTIVWMASDASSYLNGSDIVRTLHPKFSSEVQLLTGAKRSLMVGTVVGENVLNNSANITPKPSY
jgi:NAD(P)-dependent dehydrogenase (short-subunit alcohol dehydrogenase family)